MSEGIKKESLVKSQKYSSYLQYGRRHYIRKMRGFRWILIPKFLKGWKSRKIVRSILVTFLFLALLSICWIFPAVIFWCYTVVFFESFWSKLCLYGYKDISCKVWANICKVLPTFGNWEMDLGNKKKCLRIEALLGFCPTVYYLHLKLNAPNPLRT